MATTPETLTRSTSSLIQERHLTLVPQREFDRLTSRLFAIKEEMGEDFGHYSTTEGYHPLMDNYFLGVADLVNEAKTAEDLYKARRIFSDLSRAPYRRAIFNEDKITTDILRTLGIHQRDKEGNLRPMGALIEELEITAMKRTVRRSI